MFTPAGRRGQFEWIYLLLEHSPPSISLHCQKKSSWTFRNTFLKWELRVRDIPEKWLIDLLFYIKLRVIFLLVHALGNHNMYIYPPPSHPLYSDLIVRTCFLYIQQYISMYVTLHLYTLQIFNISIHIPKTRFPYRARVTRFL